MKSLIVGFCLVLLWSPAFLFPTALVAQDRQEAGPVPEPMRPPGEVIKPAPKDRLPRLSEEQTNALKRRRLIREEAEELKQQNKTLGKSRKKLRDDQRRLREDVRAQRIDQKITRLEQQIQKVSQRILEMEQRKLRLTQKILQLKQRKIR